MNPFRLFLINLEEVYFDDVPQRTGADLIRHLQSSDCPAGIAFSDFHTLLVDLSQDEDALFGQIKKDTRYDIRRAQSKEPLVTEWISEITWPIAMMFCNSYDAFAKSKGMKALNRNRIRSYIKSGKLALSCVKHEVTDQILVWHAYYLGNQRIRLLYSASAVDKGPDSQMRSLIGRANRYLHWTDIIQSKSSGYRLYDLGGWYEGTENEAKLRINAFKEEFGGTRVCEKNWEEAASPIGSLYIAARMLICK